jgi:ATP-dependent Clp protease adaptor protein ClpS
MRFLGYLFWEVKYVKAAATPCCSAVLGRTGGAGATVDSLACIFPRYAQNYQLVGSRGETTSMASGTRDSTLIEAEKSKVKTPPLFKVLLLNDDYTPMDFVVAVLQQFFSMTREQATQIMLKVHREGMGVCGVYPRDVAATKVDQVIQFSRQHQHPLQCVMEET